MIIIESRGFGLIHFIDMDRLIFNGCVACNLRKPEKRTFRPHFHTQKPLVVARDFPWQGTTPAG
jgi:hypothetical protein